MEVSLNDIGKRYNFNWIFNNITFHIQSGDCCVFLGANGSGKSTLLQLVSGALTHSIGEIYWKNKLQIIDPEHIYKYVSIAAPYLELIEEFTLREHIKFHFSVKETLEGLSLDDVLNLSGLKHAADRPIRYFSSGMKQRIKLTLAILSDTPLLLLDEPLSNLDKNASDWFGNLIIKFGVNRTIIVSSNHIEKEYFFCKRSLILEEFHS